MKRKVFTVATVLFVFVGLFTACTKKNDDIVQADALDTQKEESTEVDLNGMYTVQDPEGVEFDERYELYKPYIQADENYAEGARYTFAVIYAKEGKGQYMYAVDIFETKEQAIAYQEENDTGTVDGKAVVAISDADFFITMEAFVPTVDDWINNLEESGMMPIGD